VKVLVGKIDDIKEGDMIHFEYKDKDILIANINGKFYATSNICTHAGASLHEGKLEGTNVTCPWHGAIWDITTGNLVKFPMQLNPLERYEVIIEEDSIYIDI
jgi:nitrite reductase/ring-hydroxylating ferredoxin subunit